MMAVPEYSGPIRWISVKFRQELLDRDGANHEVSIRGKNGGQFVKRQEP